MAIKKDKSKWLNIAISWGASIVIIGVLFKILHLGGSLANYMIAIGLGVEAFLFFLMGLFPAQKQPDWSKVYPQLDENFKGENPPVEMINNSSNGSNVLMFDKMLSQADLNPEVLKNISEGLNRFSTALDSINNISDISLTSNELNNKMSMSIKKLDKLNQDFDKASSDLSKIAQINIDVPNYNEQLSTLTDNLTKLNKMYSDELHSTNNYFDVMNKYHDLLKLKMKTLSVDSNESDEFSLQIKALNNNLRAMNSVYGNMLNAMKPVI